MIYCQICGANEARFVRDHDHKTGFIRGILCEVCNSLLGAFESQLVCNKFRGKKKYKSWGALFEIKILDYLKKTTPFRMQTPIDVVAAYVF